MSRTSPISAARASALPFAVVAALVTGCSDAVEVDVVRVRQGRIEESFREPARTRLPRTWTVVMPVDARLGAVELEPGDRVAVGQPLATVDRKPLELAVVQARAEVARLEAQVRLIEYDALEQTALENIAGTLDAMHELIAAGKAQVEAQEARYELAHRQYQRAEEAVRTNAISEADRDKTEMAAKTTLLEMRTQELVVAALEAFDAVMRLGPKAVEEWLGRKDLQKAELEHAVASARAALERAEHDLGLAAVTAPIDGVVLERLHDGDGPVARGTPVVSIGDLARLEVVADVLTEDALRLAPGSTVRLQTAAAQGAITARVARIDPAGFTKLSSLGIEQQRVRVVVDLDPVPEGLGVGYRLQARFVTGAEDAALLVPRASVLQAADGTYGVFVVDGGRAERRAVELGLGSDLELQVVTGVDEGTPLVAAPDATLADGDAVRGAER